jgi:hypothetical protein
MIAAMREILLVVARSETRLYRYLKQSFADVGNVEIILDRRAGPGRGPASSAAPSEDAPTADRRRRDISRSLAGPGWAVVREPSARIDRTGNDGVRRTA